MCLAREAELRRRKFQSGAWERGEGRGSHVRAASANHTVPGRIANPSYGDLRIQRPRKPGLTLFCRSAYKLRARLWFRNGFASGQTRLAAAWDDPPAPRCAGAVHITTIEHVLVRGPE